MSVDHAIEFAAEAHQGVYRDGDFGLPYITHPIEVLGHLRYIGGVIDEEVLCAGVLHDVLEWGNADPSLLSSLFGQRVLDLVLEVTRKEPSASEIEQLSSSDLRRLRHEMLLKEIRQMSDVAKTIKLADRLSNLREKISTRTGKKLERYLAATGQVLESIDQSVNRALWDEIDRLVR